MCSSGVLAGAVVSFGDDADASRLWLAAEDEGAGKANGDSRSHFPVLTCTTCGQHYYMAFLKDFAFTGKNPGGGEAGPDGFWWPPLEETLGGKRVVLVDRLIGSNDDQEEPADHARAVPLHFCRRCGAAHPKTVSRCLSCGEACDTIQLLAIRQNKKNVGRLTSCLSCGATGRRTGGRYREPARPVRAIYVADVHILTQDMVQHAERRRLLVFCDQPAGRCVPGRLDEGSRAPLSAAGLDGGRFQGQSPIGRRSDRIPGRSPGSGRNPVPGHWFRKSGRLPAGKAVAGATNRNAASTSAFKCYARSRSLHGRRSVSSPGDE